MKPYLIELWVWLKPIVLMLSRPILGPINGFHVIMLTIFLIQNFWPTKGVKVHIKHILTKTEEEAVKLKKRIVEDGETFEAMTKHSKCPSRMSFGDLGYVGKGRMVKEFEDFVFDENQPIGQVLGPLKTEFGYHLIKLIDRKDDEQTKKLK
jgi:parvulin-like peptidyl-prolyl isomerase